MKPDVTAHASETPESKRSELNYRLLRSTSPPMQVVRPSAESLFDKRVCDRFTFELLINRRNILPWQDVLALPSGCREDLRGRAARPVRLLR